MSKPRIVFDSSDYIMEVSPEDLRRIADALDANPGPVHVEMLDPMCDDDFHHGEVHAMSPEWLKPARLQP